MRTGIKIRAANRRTCAKAAEMCWLTASFFIRIDCRQEVRSLALVETALNISYELRCVET